jgi:hypothetical protein
MRELQGRRARPLRLHAHQVQRPPAVAPLPEMRQGMPEDLWRALVPLPPMPRPGARLNQGTALPEAISIAPTQAGSGSATPGGAPLRVTSSRRRRSACVGRYGSAGRGSQPFMPWPKKCELLTAHEPPVAPLLAPFGRPTTPMSLAAPPPGGLAHMGTFRVWLMAALCGHVRCRGA